MSIFVLFCAMACSWVYITPYRFYINALNNGVKNERLKLDKFEDFFYKGSKFNVETFETAYKGNEKLWVNYHFQNFILPMPLDQPAYMMIPIIASQSEDNTIGYKISNLEGESLIEIKTLKTKKFSIDIKGQWLFNLPIFKNDIYSRSITNIWKDLFLKEIHVYKDDSLLMLDSVSEVSKKSYKELVYDLFILHMRKVYFPENVKSFKYSHKLNNGVVELESSRMLTEKIMFLKQGLIFQIELQSKKNLEEPDYLRKLFYKNLEFKESKDEAKIFLYNEHLKLAFQDRFNQRGMIILFSTLSHDLKNKKLIKEIIRYLERGRPNLLQIEPFYDYAFSLFGTNFSEIGFYRKEDNENLLRRKAVEEQEKEKSKVNVIKEDEYANEDEKIKDFLNKAKSKSNKDKEINNLINEN